jgi:hypothetical protein
VEPPRGPAPLADRLGIPRPEVEDPAAGLAWLVPANLALAAAVLVLAFGAILTEPDALLRTAAAHAAAAEVLAIGLLAHGARRSRLQLVALGVGVVGAVAWGWAWIAPGAPSGPLDRTVVVLVALVAAACAVRPGPAKFFPPVAGWTGAARRLVPALLVLAAAALAVVFGAECWPGGTAAPCRSRPRRSRRSPRRWPARGPRRWWPPWCPGATRWACPSAAARRTSTAARRCWRPWCCTWG